MKTLEAKGSGPLRGTLQVPGDKSISHRALMLAAIAEGHTTIQGLLHSADTSATLTALRHLGACIDCEKRDEVRVQGLGLYGLNTPKTTLDLGNSGTAARLMAGLLCGQRICCRLGGDASLQNRPMRRILDPLGTMGARIEATPDDTMPLVIAPVEQLTGIHWHLRQASAQVKSAILLAALYADGETIVNEPVATRDHTERMLTSFGQTLQKEDGEIRICPAQRLHAAQIHIPGDLSSAAFFIVAASLIPGSAITLKEVGLNPHRDAALTILRQMGAHIEIHAQKQWGKEPVGDIDVRAAPLHGITIAPELVPGAIDEFPAILVAAAFAEGRTTLRHAKELRVKESDRIAAMAAGLTRLGIEVEEEPEGITVQGGRLKSGTVESDGDHRIAMAFAIAGASAVEDSIRVQVSDCSNIATSFPDFVPRANALGLQIRAY